MSNKTYREFMREKLDYSNIELNTFDDLGSTSHGSDKESFKNSYENVYNIKGIKIYHLDNPEVLRVGYVIDYGDYKIWHTVRLSAWTGKINGMVCNNFEKEFPKEIPKEIKYTKYNRFEIMDI